MLIFIVNYLLGSTARASELLLDADARLVMIDRWTLDWSGYGRSRHFLACCRPILHTLDGGKSKGCVVA
ncbi:MAG: hypothetical protein CTY20_13830 [Hyphomicrobium sp.]|nr:MAG: hypothetical protein CTY20_13830 [Hyphomicrobium sp.]